MTTPVERLLHRLELEQTDATEASMTWQGHAGAAALNLSNRLFGGLVVAQSIVAAGRTHPDATIHSVQQVFLRGGAIDTPLRYHVERLFNGRTYASLRVEVRQGDQLISHAVVGLTTGIPGPDRQDPAPSIAPLDMTVNRDELRNRPNWQDQPVMLHIDPATENDGTADLAQWVCPAGPMPVGDQLLHQAVLAYASDRGLMSLAWKPHADTGGFIGSTLDHSIWFHRPVSFDDWHSYVMHSPTISGGRGLTNGRIHDADGIHIASTTQQGTFRPT